MILTIVRTFDDNTWNFTCSGRRNTQGEYKLAKAKYGAKSALEKKKLREVAQRSNRHHRNLRSANMKAATDKYKVVREGCGSWGLGDHFHVLSTQALVDVGYLDPGAAVIKRSAAEWELTGRQIPRDKRLDDVIHAEEFCNSRYMCCLRDLEDAVKQKLAACHAWISSSVVRFAPLARYLQPVICIAMSDGTHHIFQCLCFTQAHAGNVFAGTFLRYAEILGSIDSLPCTIEAQRGSVVGAEDIEEELAKSGSDIASILHLETKRGRTLPELLIVGSDVFDRDLAEREQEAIADAKRQLAIAKSMASAGQRRVQPSPRTSRRPQKMGTQRVALHIPELVPECVVADAAQDPAEVEVELPSSGEDEWVLARDGHSGKRIVAMDSELRSRSLPDAVEYGGWVFSCGKRIGRITASYPDPAGSSESAPMAYVCCYKHGSGCGKWVPMSGDVDRASLLRWLRAWRFYYDSAAHLDALHIGEAYQSPPENLAAVLPDDVPPPPPVPRTVRPSDSRQGRLFCFGPWSVSMVCPDGMFTAWGANCGDHTDYDDKRKVLKRCKTSMAFGTRCSCDEARRRCKFWLIQGLEIERPFGRKNRRALQDHLDLDFRQIPIADIPEVAELDRMAEEEEERRLLAKRR